MKFGGTDNGCNGRYKVGASLSDLDCFIEFRAAFIPDGYNLR